VEAHGRITDAESGQGIRGATFLVLQPGISVDAFRWSKDEVYAWAETDCRGYLELSARPQRGKSIAGSSVPGATGRSWRMELASGRPWSHPMN